ncbi:hypothetical protein ACFZCG_19200 [Streptomyces tanashiensis]|uniref:hypothetical protein n=1 Tax=Streptomyces tanashiensis TaxID=67367 RepID=UPI0036E29119
MSLIEAAGASASAAFVVPRSSGSHIPADAAVSLVVGNLPAGLGPAVAHEQTGR